MLDVNIWFVRRKAMGESGKVLHVCCLLDACIIGISI